MKKVSATKFQNISLFFAIVIIPALIYYNNWQVGIFHMLVFGVGMFCLGNNFAMDDIQRLEKEVEKLKNPGIKFNLNEDVIVNGYVGYDKPDFIVDIQEATAPDSAAGEDLVGIEISYMEGTILAKNDKYYIVELHRAIPIKDFTDLEAPPVKTKIFKVTIDNSVLFKVDNTKETK